MVLPAEHSTDLATSVGREIRDLRKVRGLTLSSLAALCDKSVGYLSQVERGITKPSVGSLQDISDALGVHVGWFFQPAPVEDTAEARYVVRAGARRRLTYSRLSGTDYLGMRDELLSSNLGGQMAMVMTRYAPGASSGDDFDNHDGEEAGYVQSGLLQIHLGEDVFLLHKGDSFSFPSNLPHRYSNPGEDETIVIFSITPVVLHY